MNTQEQQAQEKHDADVKAHPQGTERPWVDAQGRPIVRDVNGKIIPYGSGKCALCGRDAVDPGTQVAADGKPLARNAQGKQVGTDRHGNVFDDRGVLVKTKPSATAPLVVDADGKPVPEAKP
jgi:hypothetical protein